MCVYICAVLSPHFSTIPKEGGIVVWRKLALLFQVSQLTFSSCGVSPLLSLPLLSVSLLRSLSLSFSLFLSLTPSLSLFGHSDVRFWITASLSGAAGEFPCAVWSLIPPKSLLLLLICSVTEDGMLSSSVAFLKIYRNLLPLWIWNHPPVALRVKTKRVPFS